ncbi:hypothetical protein CDEST_11356 [Colletotrichum destructivum]|uniref:Transposase n=1 Tax=Colletotrichum destructivum TaxID=34406 RepID=A0AAX4ITG3_9PEZI|nr:hypothetical protein CDEST_11356 [Colletotrichum destructivum]
MDDLKLSKRVRQPEREKEILRSEPNGLRTATMECKYQRREAWHSIVTDYNDRQRKEEKDLVPTEILCGF